MTYVFVFLGEFGYEIFNWQGAVRKFSYTINKKKDKIIICSRKGLELFYEFADLYIDISDLELFKNSVASRYVANNPDLNDFKFYKEVKNQTLNSEKLSKKNKIYIKSLKKQIKSYAKSFLIKKNIVNLFNILRNKVKFIFSSDFQIINGIEFGRESTNKHAYIYEDLKLYNNIFKKINILNEDIENVQNKLSFDLKEDFILCQSGSRDIVMRDETKINYYDIISKLNKHIKIILLNFDTNRKMDSKYFFSSTGNNTFVYTANSFREQAVLIEYSKKCLFFSEGDFRSYNYLPPFFGKNVYSIFSKHLLNLETVPIDFWNNNVYKYIGNGKIIPIYIEDLTNNTYLDNFYNLILS